MKKYLSADQAAEMLGVSKATLYAYVSRGLIRSEETGEDNRTRRYLAEDVRKLQERKEYRRNPAQVAQDALHWGTPLLDSALTLINDDGLYYRGRDATELARTSTIEQVAALFWTGREQDADKLFATGAPTRILEQINPDWMPMQRITVALTLAGVDDLGGYNLQPEAVAHTGARILSLTRAALTMQQAVGDGIAARLRAAWQADDDQLDRLLDAALILCADHELNVSSFTARVVASADATPYAVVTAGLAALQGLKHGGISEQVEALLREIASVDRIARVTADRLRRGERIPGFGHALYPQGDVRAKTLLNLLETAYPDTAEVEFVRETAIQVTQMIEHQPNIDFALAGLAHVAHLPPGSALALFALGRTVGWIGHAIEQYRSGVLIRPRARYVGEPPAKKD